MDESGREPSRRRLAFWLGLALLLGVWIGSLVLLAVLLW